MVMNEEYRKFDGRNVEATPIKGYDFSPDTVIGECVVTESRPLSGGEVLAYIYTVGGYSVEPSSIKERRSADAK